MFSGKKFVIMMTLIMITSTILQYLLKEFEVVSQIQTVVDEVTKGLKAMGSLKL